MYLMEVDAYPLLSFMRALRPQVIAGAVVGAVSAAVAASSRRVARVSVPRRRRRRCCRGGYAGAAAVLLRLTALRGDPSTLIAIFVTVQLLLQQLLLQQWIPVSPT